MTYNEIIKGNCEKHTSVKWWPKFAYHYTDVENAVGILASGVLYSRVKADAIGVMKNENASRQVINMTESQTTSYVRFYFRPLTPTQYHNEGFKHCKIRYCGDDNANIPVPVFLLFDLDRILSLEDTSFSALSQAGHRAPIHRGVEAFTGLPFDDIYSSGPASKTVMQHRHAEILFPMQFPITGIIRCIICRNECERTTLLNLLRMQKRYAYEKYKDIIKVGIDNVFYRNGLFIEEVIFHEDSISFAFSDAPGKLEYVDRVRRNGNIGDIGSVKCRFLFEWLGSKELVFSGIREIDIPYLNAKSIVFNQMPTVEKAKLLRVTVSIEGKMVCVFEQALSPYELI